MPAVLSPAVERGAALLDEKCPGWAERVDVESLNIASMRRCILGQLYGHYTTGRDRLELGIGSTYGFDSHLRGYDELNQDWRLAILSRRA
jgi:hypothetical protein